MTSVFILVLCLCLGLVTSKPSGRIVGGQKARAGQFPWQAAVYVDTADGKFFCGGTLVAAEWVLSAAHCLYNARLYTIHFGSTTLQSGDANRVILASSTSVIFPNFDPNTLENDIGLIRLHMAVELGEYIRPINIATLGLIHEGMVAVASGWGQISDGAPGIVNDLNYVNVAIISNTECQATYGDQIKASMLCTQGNFNEGICLGDTGGPLVINLGTTQPLLVGVAGFYSQQGCEALHPSGYVRTDLYNTWIQNTTQSL